MWLSFTACGINKLPDSLPILQAVGGLSRWMRYPTLATRPLLHLQFRGKYEDLLLVAVGLFHTLLLHVGAESKNHCPKE